MSRTRTAEELLIVAIQDLYDAAKGWTERHEKLGKATRHPALTRFVGECGREAKTVSGDLGKLAKALGAPAEDAPNIWLRATLDDAERDSKTIVEGSLRDIALVGAFRKAKQAERVSYETALLLARRLKQREAVTKLILMRDDAADADAELARQLRELTSTLDV